MPILFYGTTAHSKKRCLHNALLDPMSGSVFDNYKIEGLAPYLPEMDLSGPAYAIANHWHLVDRSHTAMSWHHRRKGHEQTIIMPGFYDHIEFISLCRIDFGSVMPSPLIFRVNNEWEPYAYHD